MTEPCIAVAVTLWTVSHTVLHGCTDYFMIRDPLLNNSYVVYVVITSAIYQMTFMIILWSYQ